MKIIILSFFLFTSSLLWAIGQAPVSPLEKRPYRIATTTGMVTDIVRNVVDKRAEVIGIIGQGVDPHLYNPTRNDVATLMNADVVFYSGLLLEGKMGDVLVRLARKGKPVFAVTELIDPSYLLEPEAFQGHYDPHVWMDVKGWMKTVEVIANALSDYDSINRSYYQANAAAYLEKMKALDHYASTTIQTIPEGYRVMVTAHDAFNYFGRAYGLEVIGIQGISTESEAGLKDINELVDLLVKRNIKAVFVETSVADKNVKVLIEGARARGHKVIIGGELFSDAMGPSGSYEGTYIGMVDHNVTIVTRALGGNAPEKGMQGKLK